MRSRTTGAFRDLFGELPPDVRRQARAAYSIWRRDTGHPGLQFKRLHPIQPVYSVRIGRSWRALGRRRDGDAMIWFWIGSHADYDRLLAQL